MTIDQAIDVLNDLDDQLDSDNVNQALAHESEQERQNFQRAKLDLEDKIEVLQTNRLQILADDLDANAAALTQATQEAKESATQLDNIAKVIAAIAKVITIAGKIAAHV